MQELSPPSAGHTGICISTRQSTQSCNVVNVTESVADITTANTTCICLSGWQYNMHMPHTAHARLAALSVRLALTNLLVIWEMGRIQERIEHRVEGCTNFSGGKVNPLLDMGLHRDISACLLIGRAVICLTYCPGNPYHVDGSLAKQTLICQPSNVAGDGIAFPYTALWGLKSWDLSKQRTVSVNS